MDVTQLPFNRHIGLEVAADAGFLVSLPDGPQYINHVGTVHASALLAVAEAGSGAFLAQQFGPREGFVPVVRRLEAKFRKPAQLQIGDRLADETGEWEVAGRPYTTAGGKTAHVRVQRVGQSDAIAIRTYGAHERIALKRATA